MSLPSAVRQFSILHFYPDPHECYCLALFMHPPPSSLEPREVIAQRCSPILHSPLFFRSPMNVIAQRCSSILHSPLFFGTHEFIAQHCSCILHHRVWSPAKLLCSVVRQFSIINFFQSPRLVLGKRKPNAQFFVFLTQEFQLLPKLARSQPLIDKAKLQNATSVEEALEIARESLQGEAAVQYRSW